MSKHIRHDMSHWWLWLESCDVELEENSKCVYIYFRESLSAILMFL